MKVTSTSHFELVSCVSHVSLHGIAMKKKFVLVELEVISDLLAEVR